MKWKCEYKMNIYEIYDIYIFIYYEVWIQLVMLHDSQKCYFIDSSNDKKSKIVMRCYLAISIVILILKCLLKQLNKVV